MNERIEELAKEAGHVYVSGHPVPYYQFSDTQLEKFAQLIVRECADICCRIDDEHGEDDSIAYWAAKEILEHFGLIDE